MSLFRDDGIVLRTQKLGVPEARGVRNESLPG